jgi:hypothetical protein
VGSAAAGQYILPTGGTTCTEMDKKLATQIANTIEELHLENLALKSFVKTMQSWNDSQIETLLDKAKKSPEVRKIIQQQLKPLRDHLESDTSLEDAFREYLKVAPPPKKDVN